MDLTFKILAAILLGVAAFFFWRGDTEAVFVSAVLGAVAYLLSIRFQLKARIKKRAAEEPKGETREN